MNAEQILLQRYFSSFLLYFNEQSFRGGSSACCELLRMGSRSQWPWGGTDSPRAMPALGRDSPFLVPFHFSLLFIIGEAEAALGVCFLLLKLSWLGWGVGDNGMGWSSQGSLRLLSPRCGLFPLPTLGALLCGPHCPAGFQ